MAANWNSVSVAKKSLRIQYLKSRANLDINYKIQSSAVISDYLKKIILPNSIVYAYHPITNEVDILPFMIELYSFNQNYSFALPLCFADKSCEFRKWDPAVPLVKNPMINVLEPAQVMPLINEPDVILVPMICFDQDLNRLGRGGGYYDRVLKNHPKSLKVGCAFSVQCTQSIPTESHDVSLDIRLLICHVLGFSSNEELMLSYDRKISEQELSTFKSVFARRLQNEPIAYILGSKDFWDYSFKVTGDVLIPRPETESIIEVVLKYYTDHSSFLKILDLGTGSGCIAISLLKLYPNATATMVDISDKALIIAQENCINLAISQRANLIQSDWLSNVVKDQYDIITCNPPYISIEEWIDLPENVKNYEPKVALTDNYDGLLHYIKIFEDILPYLHKKSILLLECGHNQASVIVTIALKEGLRLIDIIKDLAGIPRVIILGL